MSHNNQPEEDEWAANPYSASNPKHHSYNEEKSKLSRAALNDRFYRGDANLPKLRTADYAKESIRPTDGAFWKERSQSPDRDIDGSGATGIRKKVEVPPSPIVATVPALALAGATAVAQLHGGATIWLGTSEGTIKVFSGHKLDDAAPAAVTFEGNDATSAVSALIAVGHGVIVGRANGSIQCFDANTSVLIWNKTATTYVAAEGKEDKEGPLPGIASLHFHPSEPLVLAVSDTTSRGTTELSYWDVAPQLATGEELADWQEAEAEKEAAEKEAAEDEKREYTAKTVEQIGESRQTRKVTLTSEVTAVAWGSFEHPALWIGSVKGVLTQLDQDDLVAIRTAIPEAPAPAPTADQQNTNKKKAPPSKKDGAGATIVALTCFGHTLAIAFEKASTVNLYSLELPNFPLVGAAMHHGTSPVTSLSLEERSSRVVSVDTRGILSQWDAKAHSPTLRTQVATGLPNGEGLSCMSQRCTTDATRLWTTAGSGINHVWWMQQNPATLESEFSLEHMKKILGDNERSLGEWEAKIETAHRIKAQRREAACSALCHVLTLNTIRDSYWRLVKWRLKMQQIKRRLECAIAMSPTGERKLRSQYFSRLMRFAAEQRNLKQKRTIACYVLGCTDKGMRRLYFEKLHEFLLIQRRDRNKMNLGELILRNTTQGLQRIMLRKWFKATDLGRYRRKREILSSAMLKSTTMGVGKSYFFNWLKFTSQGQQSRKKNNIVGSLLRLTEKGVRTLYLSKLRSFLRAAQTKKTRDLWSNALRQNSEGVLRSDYYGRLVTFSAMQRTAKLKENIRVEEARRKELQVEHDKISVRIAKMKKLKELREAIAAQTQQQEEVTARKEGLTSSKSQLEKQVAVKEDRKEKDESLRDEFLNVMSTLKARCVNFNSDLPLVQKLVLQAQKSEPFKLFLSSHMEIKRLTIEVSGEPTAAPKWNFGESTKDAQNVLKKYPSHNHTSILTAIRTMVVAFDLMSQEDLDKLDTDEEIVANAEVITSMFDTFSAAKRKSPATAGKT